jgi:hypothetical protein
MEPRPAEVGYAAVAGVLRDVGGRDGEVLGGGLDGGAGCGVVLGDVSRVSGGCEPAAESDVVRGCGYRGQYFEETPDVFGRAAEDPELAVPEGEGAVWGAGRELFRGVREESGH